ncbi:MAG TPA: DUF3137 domain-containing protein [Chitinophagaceae bacterium]|nr:DUF3137 domain-containing protein [Chitinophagaceae bacterium]
MPSPQNFYELFVKELEALLEPLEGQRKRLAKQIILGYSLLGWTFVLFIITSSSGSEITGVLTFVSFVTGAIITGIANNNRKGYVSTFKEKIVRRVINFIDPSLHYEPQRKVSQKDFERSGLFLKTPDSYSGDDYVEGSRGKTYFCFSELHVTRSVGDNSVTFFKGLFFIAEFNKHFQGRTYVWSETNPQLGFFRKIFTTFADDLEKVKLESVDFKNSFSVYSSDQVEARYILTPSFMERLIRLEQLIGQGISFSFVNTYIFVAVPMPDNLFEPAIYRPNNYDIIGDYYNTVCMVFEMIDELNLNLRIWNKE